MRLRMLAWGAALGLLVALFTPMAALAQAETTTTHFSDTETNPISDVCTGAPVTFIGTFEGVVHTTALPDGSFHMTLTVVGEFLLVPEDPSQPTLTGKTIHREGSNLNPQNNFTYTQASYFVVKGPDGPIVNGSQVIHVTRQPDGTVTVEFDKFRVHCS